MQHGHAVNNWTYKVPNICIVFSTETVNHMQNAAQIQLDRHNCKAQLDEKNNRHSNSWQINYFVVQVKAAVRSKSK